MLLRRRGSSPSRPSLRLLVRPVVMSAPDFPVSWYRWRPGRPNAATHYSARPLEALASRVWGESVHLTPVKHSGPDRQGSINPCLVYPRWRHNRPSAALPKSPSDARWAGVPFGAGMSDRTASMGRIFGPSEFALIPDFQSSNIPARRRSRGAGTWTELRSRRINCHCHRCRIWGSGEILERAKIHGA